MIKKSWLSHIVSRKRLLYNDSVRLRFQNLRGYLMKQIKSISLLRLVKLCQLILLILSAYLAAAHFGMLISSLPLILCFLLELFVPSDYKWGFAGRKNVFLTNVSPHIENTILLVLVVLLSALAVSFTF